jgi:hypothetical protein
MGMVSAGSADRTKHMKAALGLLEKAGSATAMVQQLELDMRGAMAFVMITGNEKKQNARRMQELMAQNSSLRIDSMGLYYMTIGPQLYPLFGAHPAYWDAGKVATQDTVRDGLRLRIDKGAPLFAKAVEESVGARKEWIRINCDLCFSAQYMGTRSTDETAEMHQEFLEAKWGRDGSLLTAGCMDYRFDRHFMISQGIGSRDDQFLGYPSMLAVAEYCGDVQQMVQLHEKQLNGMREFVKRGVPGRELPYYCLHVAPNLTGLELNALHPFGKDFMALLESCEGKCANPSDCEEWYASVECSAYVARFGEGRTSKDGLHCTMLKSHLVTICQATISLSLASTGTSNFNLNWLAELLAPDDPKLHDSMRVVITFVNARVLIAEALEWQGRHKEAIRCANSIFPLSDAYS